MIKVLIADDEKKVCQLIYNLVKWEDYFMEVVGMAYHGIEAMEKIEVLKPNLVITDIRMPCYSGLEIIEKCFNQGLLIDFILISGYKYFEYAQTAIKFGVSDYLLKPINQKELIKTLEKIKNKRIVEKKLLESQEILKNQSKFYIGQIRKDFLKNVLLTDSNEILSIQNINKKFKFNFEKGLFICFDLKIDTQKTFNNNFKNLVSEKIKNIFKENIASIVIEAEFFYEDYNIYGIINFEPDKEDIIKKQLENSLELFIKQMELLGRFDITLGLSGSINKFSDLKKALDFSKKAVLQRIFEGSGKIINTLPDFYNAEFEEKLMLDFNHIIGNGIELLDIEKVQESVNYFIDEIKNNHNNSGEFIYNMLINAYRAFVIKLYSAGYEKIEIEKSIKKFTGEINLFSEFIEICNFFGEKIINDMKEFLKLKEQENSKPIRIAKQYIKNYYMNSITLEDICSIVNFNPSYFSTMFKKETGENFTEYLTKIRIEKAKELLKTTEYKLSYICELVGYNDVKHFTKSFEKYTGLKPRQFKKLYN